MGASAVIGCPRRLGSGLLPDHNKKFTGPSGI